MAIITNLELSKYLVGKDSYQNNSLQLTSARYIVCVCVVYNHTLLCKYDYIHTLKCDTIGLC